MPRIDAGLVQTFLALSPIVHPQYIQMVDRTRPLRLMGKRHTSRRTGKECVVAMGYIPAL